MGMPWQRSKVVVSRRGCVWRLHGAPTASSAMLLRCYRAPTALRRRCHGVLCNSPRSYSDCTELPWRSLRSYRAFTALPSRFHGVLCDATALLPRFHGVATECYAMNAPLNRSGNAATAPWERNERGGSAVRSQAIAIKNSVGSRQHAVGAP